MCVYDKAHSARLQLDGMASVFFTIGKCLAEPTCYFIFFCGIWFLWFCRNTKKAREPYCCSSNGSRPSHCPPMQNEQCRGLTRNMNMPTSKCSRASILVGYTYPLGIYYCYILDIGNRSCEVPNRQERALSKRFLLCLFLHPHPTLAHDRASAVCGLHRQNY